MCIFCQRLGKLRSKFCQSQRFLVNIQFFSSLRASEHIRKIYHNWYCSVPTIYQKEGYGLYMARALKNAGSTTPLLGPGTLYHPDYAKQIIEDGTLELMLLAHQRLAGSA